MLNGNIFREAKELLETNPKPFSEMTEEEVLIIKAATIPLFILPEYNDISILDGLESLATLMEGYRASQG